MRRETNTSALLIFTSIICAFCIFSMAIVVWTYLNTKKEQEIEWIPGRPLPAKFMVDPRIIGPVPDQGPRGTCWLFQAIAILEAEYKRQGLEMGYLKDNQFLKISEEALGTGMVEFCMKNPKHDVCIDSPRSKNTTQAGALQEIFQFISVYPDLLKYILPEECCPYNVNPEDEMNCPNLKTCLKSLDIRPTLSHSFKTMNLRDVKQRLIDSKLPLALGLTMPVQRYFFECDNPVIDDPEEAQYRRATCSDQQYMCPHDPSKYCCPVDYKLYKNSSVSFGFTTTGTTVAGTGHAVLLVGYNDALPLKREFNFSKQADHIGGLIARNSWGARGHSLEYLIGLITEEQEYSICPNSEDVTRWVPSDLPSLEEYQDPHLCSLDAAVVRGKRIIRHGDVLICHNKTHCTEGKKYALLRESDSTDMYPSIVWSDTGVPLARVVDLETLEVKTITSVPIQHLYYAFHVEDWENNTEGKCGYLFIPYEALDDLSRYTDGPDAASWEVEGFTAQWPKKAFTTTNNWVQKSMYYYDLYEPTRYTDLL